MTEQQLLEKIRSGDQQAFFLLVQQYREKVLNTCFRFLLNQQDAEDISQNIFVEVFLSLPKFRGEAKLSTWIYRIAVSKCLDELKRRKRKKRINLIGRSLHMEALTNWLVEKEGADDHLLEKESLQQLEEFLEQLPENQRIALTLSRMEGYSNMEIAEIMKVSRMAVDSLISRARKKLEALYPKNQ